MMQDRRAWWMETWLRGTRAFVTQEVVDDPASVVRVLRDEEGDWQLFHLAEGDPDEARLMHLFHLVDADPSLADVLDLQPEEEADRAAPGTPWVRRP